MSGPDSTCKPGAAASVRLSRLRASDPAPAKGLREGDFRRICDNGFGDGHNSFPHAMAWFRDGLLVGTTRSNFLMAKVHATFRDLPVHLWPVEGPDDIDGLYRELDRRAQLWSYDPPADRWERVFVSPEVASVRGDAQRVARETGYRAMTVFEGTSDAAPALYLAGWATSRAPGAVLLRSDEGRTFRQVTPYGIIEGLPVTATRLLVPFKGRLFTSPTGTRGYAVDFVINVCGHPVIYETSDPSRGRWKAACLPGFGDAANAGIFSLRVFQGHLYAGTFNNHGFEIWRSDCEGDPPYRWERVLDRGAGRGAENQIAATMTVFGGALYVGTAIQNGGNDRTHHIGPAGAELIRIHPDHSWDLIVGAPRVSRDGHKSPLSGLPPGFGNLLNGYVWSMEVHEGWLYLGTMNSTIWIRFLDPAAYDEQVSELVRSVGAENIVANDAGCCLWRSADGENWLPVSRTGFGNPYNLGVRNLRSTPYGLFVGVANPFGPRVAARSNGVWGYVDNPRGGCEIWLGRR